MKRVCARFCLLVLSPLLAVFLVGGSAAGQTIEVVGTGNPDVDIPAVQAAVNQGSEVILRGHFSFDNPPTVPTAAAGLGPATILVSRTIVISGTGENDDDLTTIEGGTIPFYVDAPGTPVTIQRLHFVHPSVDAINVYAVSGLTIASCKIEAVEPGGTLGGEAIGIYTTFLPPTPTNPGKPENISGTLSIVNNDIDVLAGKQIVDPMLGITVFSAGVPGAEVEVYVSGNSIKNVTEPAIDFRLVGGRVYIDRNVVKTGSVSGSTPRPQAIRAVNSGSYLIAHNSIDCGWENPDAEGIGVFSQVRPEVGQQWPIKNAIVVDNDVTMSPPEGTVFGTFSAAIGVYGSAESNVVLNNRIRGRAKAALYLDVFRGGIPDNNALVLNRFSDFVASVADIFVGNGVKNTRILGPGTVEDHGINTVILPFRL